MACIYNGVIRGRKGDVAVEIQKGVHLLESTKGSFVYLVLDRNEPLLIDTGNPGKHEKIEAELAKLGVSLNDIAHILLTHSDVDHIGNAKSLQRASGAKVWAPQDDLPYIHGTKKHKGLRRLIGAVVKAEKPEVDATYEPGQHVGSVEMIPTPGHTPGHVSFRYGDILFTGDLVMTSKGKIKPAPSFLTADKVSLKRSLQDVGKLSFDWVCPAHGTPVRRGNLWEAMMQGR